MTPSARLGAVAAALLTAASVVATPQPGRLVAASFTIKGGRYGTVWALPLLLFLVGWAVRSLGARDLRSFASRTGD
jgi:cell division protein FtsX